MITKSEVKYIQSLSDKKNRDSEGLFIAEGPKLMAELLGNHLLAKIIYTTEDVALFNAGNAEIKKIEANDLCRISQWQTPNGMLGVFYKRELPVLQLQNTITLALDGLQDPGNLGTIIRTADWFGIHQIIASKDTVDCYNSKVVQSTMGSLARVAVYYDDLASLFNRTSVSIFGAVLEGESIFSLQEMQEGIVVIGNESKGIRNEILTHIQKMITIPRIGKAESLNAAVATGIILSQIKQKNDLKI